VIGANIAATVLLMTTNTKIEVDLTQRRDPIHPYIYGQFIEHLGRCIYGGIWAEMLEDRKFFFPVTNKYAPYSALKNSEFPVIGASPWQIVRGSVEMSTKDPFVGKHTPLLNDGTELKQNDLGVLAGKSYVGYIWLKSTVGKPQVHIEFENQTHSINTIGGEYKKYSFEFKPKSDSNKASISVRVEGGGVALGTLSLMPADNVRGMRRDTLARLKELGGTIYRWPGGNFVSGYDWRDGIGDRDRRPPRTNPAWGGLEHNDFGTDEFIDFCREIGTEPLVTVNTGFGDAYTAAQWVEYCNGSAQTIGGSWRIKNGHRKPYGVKVWCVGNEMWGDWQLGYMKLEHYAAKHNWVAEAMLKVDPNLVLVGSGEMGNSGQPDSAGNKQSWSKGLMERSGDHMDMISEHFYAGRLPWNKNPRFPIDAAIRQMADLVRQKAVWHRDTQSKMKQLKGKKLPIAMDEWNYWHRDYAYGELGCEYDLADALGIAAGLHEFYRNTDIIHLATYAQTVNVIGAIKTSKTAAEMESTGLALQIYRKHFGQVPVKLSGTFGKLDLEAAMTSDGKFLTIGVVNPTGEAIQLDLPSYDLSKAKSYWVTGDSEFAKNTPGKPRQVDIVELKGSTVPKISCGVIKIPL
jgi:alpha-L-arabinofuranosidase